MKTSKKALWLCRILVPLGWALYPILWAVAIPFLLVFGVLSFCKIIVEIGLNSSIWLDEQHNKLRRAWSDLVKTNK